MRTPAVVGLLGAGAVGVLAVGLSMAWADEPAEDYGGPVLASPGAPAPTPSGQVSPTGAVPAPTSPALTLAPVSPAAPSSPTRVGGGLVTVPPPGAVQLDDDDAPDDGDDDSDDDEADEADEADDDE
ncbi:hypothetical protein AB1207_19820 [Kineococcus endophyticus]|uniref:Small hydrophilic protein n=1 Tax=Kineococcus endophyticus TaxID=1181883 RepID=A0ABV3PBJ5_9ACTN